MFQPLKKEKKEKNSLGRLDFSPFGGPFNWLFKKQNTDIDVKLFMMYQLFIQLKHSGIIQCLLLKSKKKSGFLKIIRDVDKNRNLFVFFPISKAAIVNKKEACKENKNVFV